MNANTQARVLVLEDERLLGMMLEHCLSLRGHACVVEPTLKRALDRLQAEEFDAVVSDLYLPDTDTGILGAVKPDQLPPVIVITASPTLESSLRAIESGAYAYQTKPFDADEFITLIESAATLGRMQHRMKAARSRLQTLLGDIEGLCHLRPFTSDALDQTLVDYIGLLLSNNIQSLAEATELLGLISRDTAHRPVRHISRHPEAELFRTALTHTVEVLERTRHSFKSRELAELRRQLEGILYSTGEKTTSSEVSPPLVP